MAYYVPFWEVPLNQEKIGKTLKLGNKAYLISLLSYLILGLYKRI